MPHIDSRDSGTDRARLVRIGLTVAACALALGLCIASLRQPHFGWVLANGLLLGVPALALVAMAREGFRIALARILGFQLFGVRWGLGRGIATFRLFGIHHHFAWLPIGADARVASPHPKSHRFRRFSIAAAPALAQVALAWLGLALGALSFEPLTRGFDGLLVFQFANLMLLALHVFVPFETQDGLCSDLRLVLILSVATVEEDRAARASAHVMRIEAALADGEFTRAEALLRPAIVQLGREPMLVQVEDRIARIKADPDPDSAARDDATTDPFEHSWSYWDRSTGSLPLFRRLAVGAAAASPLALAFFLFSTFHSAPLLASLHDLYTSRAERFAEAQVETECRSQVETYAAQVGRLSAIATIPPEMQIRELGVRARLNACGGDFDRAIRDQSLAVQIAERVRADASGRSDPSLRDPLEGELLVSSQMRSLSLLHAASGSYREALRTTGLADREIARVLETISAQKASAEADADRQRLGEERTIIEQTRSQILEGMYARS